MKLFQTGFNKKGRTENVVRNINVALVCQIINTILGFVARSIFVSLLGKTYLGVNGVFSNILTILNFAELGLGTAIVYNLYKPLKEHDVVAVSALVNFYKKAYLVIASIVVVAGLAMAPFLKYLIKEQPDIKEDISLLYVLFLFSTVVSYFNAHKKSLLIADQRQHITSIYHQVLHAFEVVLQLIFLLLTKNYIVYLSLQILCRLAENFLVARQADRIYPFLKVHRSVKVESGLLASIRKDVGALFIYKINSAVIHGTDNILITALEEDGVQSVGLYSNYTLISETLNTILGIVTNALTPSIGNLNAESNAKSKEEVFNTILYVCSWLYGFACVGIIVLSESFISVWLGSEYVLAPAIVAVIALQLYIRSVHYAAYTFRVTTGLFVQSKFVPIFTSLLNIGLSIWWGKLWGLFGILFATSIARIFTVGISDPVLVYKYVFHKKPFAYYFRYLIYALSVIACGAVATLCIYFIPIGGWLGFVLKGIIFTIVFNGLFYATTFWTAPSQYVAKTAKHYLNRILKRKQ